MKKILSSLIIVIGLSSCHMEEVKTTCTIISHSTTSDKYGAISYYTQCSCDDGKVKSISGLSYYVLKPNTKFNYSYYIIK